jgi:pectate lyase
MPNVTKWIYIPPARKRRWLAYFNNILITGGELMKKNNIFGSVSLTMTMLVLILLGLSGSASAADYDLFKDDYIDWADLGVFADEWLNDCNSANNWCNGANFDNDNNSIDYDDYSLLAKHWFTPPSLVGHWRFDEGSGSVAYDTSGNSNNGNLNGDPNWVAGKIGSYALDLDGDGDYVSAPDNDDSLDCDSNMTIAVWMKLNDVDTHYFPVTKQPSGTVGSNYAGNYTLKIQSPSGAVRLIHQTTTGISYSTYESASNVGVGAWHHVAVTLVEGGNVSFYIGGYPAGTSSQSGPFGILNDEPVRIGIRKDMASWFNGTLDDVRIYNRALSQAEIMALAGIRGRAENPSPPNGAGGVDRNILLSWSPAADAVSHDVYFSTSFNDVNDANNSWPVATGPNDPNVYKGNQTATTYDPCGLEIRNTYYWRIDEANEADICCKGEVWSFDTNTPAFPGAQGFGICTTGGRGGTVIKVTNLNNSGTGSLREAVEASGPRIVLFEVSGTIDLLSTLRIDNPNITIAGQTSPGGICLKANDSLEDRVLDIRTSNVVVRYLRIRPGDPTASNAVDGINIYSTDIHNIVIDHCSISWATDENIGMGSTAHDVTIQRCILSEGLYNSGHPDGHHSCGFLNGNSNTNISLHHNLFAHNDERSPRIHGGLVDFRNNVVYDFDSWCGCFGSTATNPIYFNWVGNHVKKGPESGSKHSVGLRSDNTVYLGGYVYDNIGPYRPNGTGNEWLVVDNPAKANEAPSVPYNVSYVTTLSVFDVYDNVLADCGAMLPQQDTVDERIISDVQNGTGGFIDDPCEVGGWPTLYSLTAPTDNDDDGMPNYWEEQYPDILDPNSGLDPNGDPDNDDYTNIEEYLNNTDPNGGDDTIVYISASICRAYEASEVPGEFTVYRTGDTTSALSVNYTASGSAIEGTDYTALSGSVTIPSDASSAAIAITPVNDSDVEGDEQVIVSIDPHSSYKLGLPRKALVVIEDDDD